MFISYQQLSVSVVRPYTHSDRLIWQVEIETHGKCLIYFDLGAAKCIFFMVLAKFTWIVIKNFYLRYLVQTFSFKVYSFWSDGFSVESLTFFSGVNQKCYNVTAVLQSFYRWSLQCCQNRKQMKFSSLRETAHWSGSLSAWWVTGVRLLLITKVQSLFILRVTPCKQIFWTVMNFIEILLQRTLRSKWPLNLQLGNIVVLSRLHEFQFQLAISACPSVYMVSPLKLIAADKK